MVKLSEKQRVHVRSARTMLETISRERGGSAVRGRAEVAAAARKPVVFTCSCANCVVGITAQGVNVVFVGTGGSLLPVGAYDLSFRVKGAKGSSFTITASGAEMEPITGVAPDAGNWPIEVVA